MKIALWFLSCISSSYIPSQPQRGRQSRTKRTVFKFAEFIVAQRRSLTASAAKAMPGERTWRLSHFKNILKAPLPNEPRAFRKRKVEWSQLAPVPSGGGSEVSTARLRRAGERSGRKGGSTNARRLDNRDYDRERRVRRWFEEAIIFCYRMTVQSKARFDGLLSPPFHPPFLTFPATHLSWPLGRV